MHVCSLYEYRSLNFTGHREEQSRTFRAVPGIDLTTNYRWTARCLISLCLTLSGYYAPWAAGKRRLAATAGQRSRHRQLQSR